MIHRRSEDSAVPLEPTPRTPILKAPAARQPVQGQLSPYRLDGVVPGTQVPINSMEGALTIPGPPSQGQYCPPGHPDSTTTGAAKPIIRSSFQSTGVVPTLKDGHFCEPQMQGLQNRVSEEVLPPVTHIQPRPAASRSFSQKVLGLPGKVMKGFSSKEKDSDVIKIRSPRFGGTSSLFSKLSTLRGRTDR